MSVTRRSRRSRTISTRSSAFDEAAAERPRRTGGAACDLCMVFAGAPHLGHGEGDPRGGPRAARAARPDRLWRRRRRRRRPRDRGGDRRGGLGARRPRRPTIDTSRPDDGLGARAASRSAGLPEDPASYGDAMVVLADPYTFSADALLLHLNDERPAMPVLGGLASAAAGGLGVAVPGRARCVDAGAVACSLAGVELLPCVSQGAAPVGPEMTVTGVEGNLISELASRPALERLREAISELEPDEQDLAAEGLLLGVVIDENQPDYERGDFLVRPIVGVDPESGALAFGERVRVGQTVRLHVRDARPPTTTCARRSRRRPQALGAVGCGRRAALHLQRPRRAHVRRARPRRRRARRGARGARRRLLLRRRDRPCRRSQLPSRLHGHDGRVPARSLLITAPPQLEGWNHGLTATWSRARWPRTSAPATSPPRRSSPRRRRARARIIQKAPGVVFGLEAAEEVFRQAGATVRAAGRRGRVARRGPGRHRARRGPGPGGPGRRAHRAQPARPPLGVATLTAQFVDAARDGGAVILDTRKTHPGAAGVREGRGRRRRRPEPPDAALRRDPDQGEPRAAGRRDRRGRAPLARGPAGDAGGDRGRDAARSRTRWRRAPTGCCSTT